MIINAQETLCSAIHKRLVVELKYDKDTLWRTYAPHTVFRTEKNSVVVSGFQIANPNDPKDSNQFRTFTVSNLTGLKITEELFTPDNTGKGLRSKQGFKVICTV